MKIVIYSEEYRSDLEELLKEFSDGLYTGKYDIDAFVNHHWAVYLAIIDGKAIGFSSFNIIDYYGFQDDIVSNDFIYVKPEHRTSKAMYLFSIQAGKICVDNGLQLEHYYASEHSKKLSRKLKGKKMFETYLYDIDEVRREYDRLRKIVKVKD